MTSLARPDSCAHPGYARHHRLLLCIAQAKAMSAFDTRHDMAALACGYWLLGAAATKEAVMHTASFTMLTVWASQLQSQQSELQLLLA